MNTNNHNLDNYKSSKLSFFGKLTKTFNKIIYSRIFIASLFLLIGSITTYSCNHKDNYRKNYSYHHFYEDDFDDFNNDFFREFEKLHHKMQKAMNHNRKMMNQTFEENTQEITAQSNYSNSIKIDASLHYVESNDFIEYQLNFSGINSEDINVIVENNYLIFNSKKSAIQSLNNDKQTSQSNSVTNFYYATNLPTYDQKTAPEIIKTNDKILVRFKKISTSKKNKNLKNNSKI